MTLHHFDIDDAREHGVVAAVLIQNLRFWIVHNRANRTHEFNGRTWTFNSAKAFVELFPYLSEDQIQRQMKKLADTGVLLRRADPEEPWNRTTWYAFVDEEKYLPPLSKPQPAPFRRSAECRPQNCGVGAAKLRNLSTDVNTDVNADEREAPTRLCSDWKLPEAWIQIAGEIRGQWPREFVLEVADGFRDHWVGIGGARTDWEIQWRKWVRNERRSPVVDVGGADDAGSWWLSPSGADRRGGELKMPRKQTETHLQYVARLARESGKGPWVAYVLRESERLGPEYLLSAQQFLVAVAPVEYAQ